MLHTATVMNTREYIAALVEHRSWVPADAVNAADVARIARIVRGVRVPQLTPPTPGVSTAVAHEVHRRGDHTRDGYEHSADEANNAPPVNKTRRQSHCPYGNKNKLTCDRRRIATLWVTNHTPTPTG